MSGRDWFGAGTLIERVTFSAPSSSVESTYLGRSVSYSTVEADAAAAVESGAAAERLFSGQIQAIGAHVVRVRYTAALAAGLPGWRCSWDGRVLEVSERPRVVGRMWLLFACREVQ